MKYYFKLLSRLFGQRVHDSGLKDVLTETGARLMALGVSKPSCRTTLNIRFS